MLKASKHEAGSKIRSRQRAVEDYDVDRPQVQAWRHVEPSGTNCPRRSGVPAGHAINEKTKVRCWRGTDLEKKEDEAGLGPRSLPAKVSYWFQPLPSCAFSNLIKVMTAQGLHLFPFRTEKLNLATPMVLRKRESR